MSWKATAYVNSITTGITAQEKLLLFILADYHNNVSKVTFPGATKLAEHAISSRRHVFRMLDRLEKMKLIERVRPTEPMAHTFYRFPALDEVVTGESSGDRGALGVVTVETPTGDIGDSAIRKNGFLTGKSNGKDHASGALKDWLWIKRELQSQFPKATWIRPMYLFRPLGDALGVCMPPNGEMWARAKSCVALQDLARGLGYSGVLITRYPDDWELEKLKRDAPECYAQLFDALKARATKEISSNGEQ